MTFEVAASCGGVSDGRVMIGDECGMVDCYVCWW